MVFKIVKWSRAGINRVNPRRSASGEIESTEKIRSWFLVLWGGYGGGRFVFLSMMFSFTVHTS